MLAADVDVLIYGDTETSPALRHEVPVSIGDPFLYLEHDGRRVVVTNTLEETRIARTAPYLERLLRTATDPLIAGEVIAIEPGVVDRAVGGIRVEDLLLVTGEGSRQLTGSFPHDLTP